MSGVKKYTAVIIGCGDIGFKFDKDWAAGKHGALTHFRALNKSDKFELIACADSNKQVLDQIIAVHGMKVFENHREMLREMNPELIVIATNDDTHFSILNDIIGHKPKFVFCEKPLSLKSDDINSICKKYKEAGIPLQVNYTRRFLEEFMEIKKDIDQNEIGRIESVVFYYSRGLVHNASHYIDLSLWYFGYPDKVISFSEKRGISKSDNSVSFILKYKEGPELIFIGLDIEKLSFAEIDIIGTKGRIKFNYKNEIEKYEVTSNPIFKGYTSYKLKCASKVNFENALPNAYDNAYDVISGKKELQASAENSIKIFELIKNIRDNKK